MITLLERYRNKDFLIYQDKIYSYQWLLTNWNRFVLTSEFSPENIAAILWRIKYKLMINFQPYKYIPNSIVLFTSGTTGKPKAIVKDIDEFMEPYRTPKKAFRTIVMLPLDYIGGLHTLFTQLFNGGMIIVPPSFRVADVCETIQKYKVELLPTTPTFLSMLFISDYQKYDLSSLKLITYGTEPMSQVLLDKLHKAFPVPLKQTYGMTEMGILPTQSESSKSLWIKIKADTEVKNGILWVNGENTHDRVEQKGEYFKILGRENKIRRKKWSSDR